MRTIEVQLLDQQVCEIFDSMAHQTDFDRVGRQFDQFVDVIGNADPEVAHNVTAGFAGATILERCVEHPDQVVLTETALMAGMYHGRSRIMTGGGVTVTEFITRTQEIEPKDMKVDVLYRRLESDRGQTTAIIESQLLREADVTYTVTATEGDCKVTVPRYHRGYYQDVELPLGDGGRGDVALSVLYAKNLWNRAAEQVLERTAPERHEADMHALRMLVRLQNARRTI